ncbi:MAG TPA: hypothetical protein VN131_06040 [Mobilitalea sp.]|nr:hypothetical protein [Mobilitalea sp.]
MNISDRSFHEMDYVGPFNSYIENVKDSGCYYLNPEICKDIIITAGASGVYTPKAVKKMKKNIGQIGESMEKIIPAFRRINRDVITCYAGEFAECLVEAAGIGKGVEIAIGYPKALVFKVN